jgi:hypothetical protein
MCRSMFFLSLFLSSVSAIVAVMLSRHDQWGEQDHIASCIDGSCLDLSGFLQLSPSSLFLSKPLSNSLSLTKSLSALSLSLDRLH